MVKYEWNEKHCKILTEFLHALNKNSIRYFILRNYERLPENNESKDVDIIIEPGKYKETHNILLKIYKSHFLTNYYDVKFEKAHCCYAMNVDENFYIHIDLIEGYANKGFEIFSFNELYENTLDYKFFKVLNPSYDAAMLLLYKVIGVGELKECYKDKILNIYQKNEDHFNNILYFVFDNKLASGISNHIKQNDFDWIVKKHRRLSKSSKNKAFLRNPLKTICNILCFLSEKFYRIVVCPKKYRKIIAVEAPDGTGKTTFINLLTEVLAECFMTDITKMHVYHFRPTLFPNLGELGEKAGVMEQDKDFTNPHRGKKTTAISSLVRISYYSFDYIIGGLVKIRRDVQFDKFTIFDRYSYDFLVDPLRSKINLPYSVRLFFCKLTPKPALTFVLNADKNVIYCRKQELTLEEIERQLAEFKRLEHVANGYHELDANRTPNEIVSEAVKIIVDRFTKKL